MERRGLRRNRLRLRRALAGNARGRRRLLLDRPHRLAGNAIEHIDEGLFGHLRDRLDALSLNGDVDQVRRGRRVVIPQTVMDELIVPDLLAGRNVKADYTLAVEPVAQPMAGVIV